jgi:hypothetical protein
MTTTADRIEYDRIITLVTARPDFPSQAALHTALAGINSTERTMRAKITALRLALDDAEASLDATRLHTDISRIQYAAADLDRASTARDLHWATAAHLLTQDERRALTSSATPSPGK